ncbi:MAG: putative topology modulation protein [Haloplasmataceae bacterium]|jgi:adenylate kinase family enzyme|nr:putative topology modulation protein [Haloplasmataceae bacterium]
MKKILIIGSSGSGKSTLAIRLGKKFNIPVLHIDSIFFDKGWVERNKQLFINDLNNFVNKDSFVIDGNYSSNLDHRLKVADTLFFLNFNRVYCFYGAIKRYYKFKNKTRPSIAEGCNEKIDFEFAKWILWDYPRKKRNLLLKIKNQFKGDLLIFNNRIQLNKYLKEIGVEIK